MSGQSHLENEAGAAVGIVLAVHRPNPVFLKKQIDSILAQTFENWELWIVPDGLDHGMSAELLRGISNDPRINILRAGEHMGSCRTFERGLAALPTSVEYVALSDQDDEWLPSKLEKLVHLLDATPGIAMGFCDSSVIDHDGRKLSDSVRKFEHRPACLTTVSLLARNTVSGHSILFRRSLLQRALPFPRAVFDSGMNHDYWLALAASDSGGIRFLDESLVSYRLHDTNEVGPRVAGATGLKSRSWKEQNRRLRYSVSARIAAISGEEITSCRKSSRIALFVLAAKAMGLGNHQAAGTFLRAAVA